MRKIELSTIGIILAWIIVIIIVSRLEDVSAQDTQVSFCYTRTDAGAVFTFSNIPDSWLGDWLGWYYIGDDVAIEDHILIVTGLQFDNGYSYAIVGAGDMSESYTATTEITPLCEQTPMPPVENAQMPIVGTNNTISSVSTAHTMATVQTMPIVSTGVTCVVKYPQAVVVCGT